MGELAKAKLEKVLSDAAETPDGEAFPVQFNPSSLKIKVTNTIEGGRSTARQVRQQTGNSSRTLSLELIFDTADEGTTKTPVSVREKTKQLEQFISTPQSNPDPPPRLKFQWGDLIWVGISDNIDISLDHFAENGYPLRAKVSLSIKEQDPQIQFQPGNRDSGSASPPGGKAGLPGSGTNLGFSAGISAGISAGFSAGIGVSAGISAGIGISAGAKIGVALDGETGAEFAARVGVDPEAWRGLETDLSSGASLNAGTQIGFNPSLSSSAGVGTTGGVNASKSINGFAASGLNLGTSENSQTVNSAINPANSAAINPDLAGKAMSSLGGVDASIQHIKINQETEKTQASIQAFGMDFTPVIAQPVGYKSSAAGNSATTRAITRAPLVKSGIASHSESLNASALPPPERVDTRASTFGKGIPLQPLFGVSQVQQTQKVYSSRVPFQQQSNQIPMSNNACTPFWVALPSVDDSRDKTDSLEMKKSVKPCAVKACDCVGGS